MVTAGAHNSSAQRGNCVLLTLLVVSMELCQVVQAGAGVAGSVAGSTTDTTTHGVKRVGGKGHLRADGRPVAEVDETLATREARLECGMYATAKLVHAEEDLLRGNDDTKKSGIQIEKFGPSSEEATSPKEAWIEAQEAMSKTDCPSRMRKVEMFLQFFHAGSNRFADYAQYMAHLNYLVCEMTPEAVEGWKWDGEGDCEDAWRSKMLRQADEVVSNMEEDLKPEWLVATQKSSMDWKQVGRLALISTGAGVMSAGAYMLTLGSLVVSSDVHYTSEYDAMDKNDPRRKEFPDKNFGRYGMEGGKGDFARHMMNKLFAGPAMASLAPEMKSMILSAGTGFAGGGTLVGFGGAFALLAGMGTTLVIAKQFDDNSRTVGPYTSYQTWLLSKKLEDDTPNAVVGDTVADEVADEDSPIVRNPLEAPKNE